MAALLCLAAIPLAGASAQGSGPILAALPPPQPNQTSAEYGKAVEFLNGHIIVSAPREDIIGAVHIYDRATLSLARSLFGQGLDGYGEFLHNVGLAYGRDRIQDLLLGGPNVQGGLFALKGSSSTYLDESSASPLLEPFQPAQFGYAAAVIGDVNGDGLQDYVVGAPSYRVSGDPYQKGAAFVISGRTATVLSTIVGTAWFGRFGESVAAVGDYDGDGKGDVAIGAPDTASVGGTVALYGSSNNFSTPLFQFHGIVQSGSIKNERLGTRLVAIDLDCDGVRDLVAGSYRADVAPFGSPDDGVIRALRGGDLKNGQVVEMYAHYGAENSQLGYRLISMPDMNGDRRGDIATVQWTMVGAQAGVSLQLLNGGNGTEIGSYVLAASPDSTRHVPAIAAGPDLNGDGYADILLGRPGLNRADLMSGGFLATQAHDTPMSACP